MSKNREYKKYVSAIALLNRIELSRSNTLNLHLTFLISYNHVSEKNHHIVDRIVLVVCIAAGGSLRLAVLFVSHMAAGAFAVHIAVGAIVVRISASASLRHVVVLVVQIAAVASLRLIVVLIHIAARASLRLVVVLIHIHIHIVAGALVQLCIAVGAYLGFVHVVHDCRSLALTQIGQRERERCNNKKAKDERRAL
jgi:hypothetical protein